MQYKHYYAYDVYEDGRVYSHYRQRFLVGEITKFGYLQYTLYINSKPVRVRAHRLVAQLFIPNNDPNLTVINHIDGNKLNNHYSNLEWCDAYHNNKHARDTGLNPVSKTNSERWNNSEFRQLTSKHISDGIKLSGAVSGHNNPRFRYVVMQDGRELTRQELAKMLSISQSWADICIKRSANGKKIDIFEKHNIKVRDINEKGSSTIRS